ncbi:MAG: hypothetical protein KDE47_12950 [Caldilineaceae bacterium]|nr:hypothetical protein [Caldilineaceae bacterium]MCB0108147.1 hypothetical protein [Caldilineaceae bacterium]
MVTSNLQHNLAWFETIYRDAQHEEHAPLWSVMRPRRAFLQWVNHRLLVIVIRAAYRKDLYRQL